MALPPITVPVSIPGHLWRRWKDLEPRVGIGLEALLPALLEIYVDREEQLRDGFTNIEYQI